MWIWKPHNAELEDYKIACTANLLEKYVEKTYHNVMCNATDYPLISVVSTETGMEIGVIGEVEELF